MVDGERLTFGFEGIWQGTAVLYDHQTQSLWMHLTGECFHGTLQGTRLRAAGTGRHTTWADWRRLHPETDVLAPEARLVGKPSDLGYFSREGARSGSGFLPRSFGRTIQTTDQRLAPSDLVYGVVVGGREARAYPFEALARTPLVHERLGGLDITVWFDAEARSAAAFERTVRGQALRFERTRGAWRDVETQSTWTLDGRCTAGRLKGAQLTPLRGLMSEWYGWYAHHPHTTVWGR